MLKLLWVKYRWETDLWLKKIKNTTKKCKERFNVSNIKYKNDPSVQSDKIQNLCSRRSFIVFTCSFWDVITCRRHHKYTEMSIMFPYLGSVAEIWGFCPSALNSVQPNSCSRSHSRSLPHLHTQNPASFTHTLRSRLN